MAEMIEDLKADGTFSDCKRSPDSKTMAGKWVRVGK